MLRVIQQERHYEGAFAAFMQGAAGEKVRTFGAFLRRLGVDRTLPDDDEVVAERAADVARVRLKLGRLYRAPLSA